MFSFVLVGLFLSRVNLLELEGGVWWSSITVVLKLIYVLIFLSLFFDNGESIMDSTIAYSFLIFCAI